MRIAFLIRSLDRGGAERQLVLLAMGLRRAGHDVSVLTFYNGGAFEADLLAADVSVISLGKSSRWDLLGFFLRLVRTVRQIEPHLLHGYLPSANLLVLAARPFTRNAKIAWGVRSSKVDLARYDMATRLSYWIEHRMARFPDLIVANSKAGSDAYRAARRGGALPVVIPNGFDTDAFSPDLEARALVRSTLNIGPSEAVIGFVARIDPMKDHDIFLEAAALASERQPSLHFVCVGGASENVSSRLKAKADALGVGERVRWTGERSDLAALYNAFDVATLVSKGEGFPNVVGEAMACGVPCVVSDVGAAAEIVGDTGLVVPPGDATALAAGWLATLERLNESGSTLRTRVRGRIVELFGAAALTERSFAAFRSVVRAAG